MPNSFTQDLVILSEPVHDGKKVEDRGIERCSRPMEPETGTCKTEGPPLGLFMIIMISF
jgi:hypothetical protein